MPLGEGYGIEAQMTGQEVTGGLQFEITPLKESSMPGSFLPDRVIVETPTGYLLKMPCSVASWTGLDLKRAIRETEGMSVVEQRLIFDGVRLEDALFLTTYGIEDGSMIHLMSMQEGGGKYRPSIQMSISTQMTIGAGGNIRHAVRGDFRRSQDWDRDMTLTIPIHILNTYAFRWATSRMAPACPIKARDYADAGYRFFSLAEKPGVGSSGNFGAVKSVNKLDQQRGLASGPEKPVFPRVVTIDDDDTTAAAAKAAAAKARRAKHFRSGGPGRRRPAVPRRTVPAVPHRWELRRRAGRRQPPGAGGRGAGAHGKAPETARLSLVCPGRAS